MKDAIAGVWNGMSRKGKTWTAIIAGVFVLGGIGGIMDVTGMTPEEPVRSSKPEPVAEEEPSISATSTPKPEEPVLTSEERFLRAVYDAAEAEGSGIRGLGDEWVLDLGNAICSDLEAGMAPGDVAVEVRRANAGQMIDPTGPIASELVGNAQMFLCP